MSAKTSDEEPGEALVILPGLICDSRMFGAQIRAFGAQVVDGFYDGADSIETMAEYALERMPARCALLGHSMGARVALEIWRRAPSRILRLALADAGVHPPKPGERDGRYTLRDIGRAEGAAALVHKWLPPMVAAAHRENQQLMDMLTGMACDGAEFYERQIEALLRRPDAEAVLPTIDCPTLVVVGAEDQWSPVAQHERLARRIAGARLRIVERAGHMAPAEEPARFNQFVREWLGWRSSAQNQSGENRKVASNE